MRRFKNDPLHGAKATLKIRYRAIMDTGLTIDAETRTLRMTLDQWTRFQEFIRELGLGSPEVGESPERLEQP